MTEQEFVYVDVDYLKELEETAKKVDYYKGVIDGINLAIDRKAEPQNYCDDCLYSRTCDSKEFFWACAEKATKKPKDEPQTERSNNE